MLYQIMVRVSPKVQWEPFGEAVDDPFSAMRQIQVAGRTSREVTVLQAEDLAALGQLLAEVRAGQMIAPSSSPVPGLTATPTVHVEDPALEQRRWELEAGEGSDHDCAYAFALPENFEVLSKWLMLLARHWRRTSGDGAAA